MKLAYGTYGLPGVELSTAVKAIAETGFTGIELAVGPGYLVPAEFSASDRNQLRKSLAMHEIELAALMPFLSAMADVDQNRKNLHTLGRLFELWRDLSQDRSPMVTFNMGGESWERDRDRLAANLSDMAAIAESAGGIIAVKAHFGTMVRTPAQAEWVMRKVDHPRIRLNYDLSHFSLAGFGLEQSLVPLLPWISYIHVKDAEFDPAGQYRFLLPGTGKTNYAEYFAALSHHGIAAWVSAEVSGMVFKAPGYDWRETMRFCGRVLIGGRDAATKELT